MRTEIFVSQPREITEVDTSTGELMRAYSRTTGASLPEARRVVLAMLTDAANTQRQEPRSKPEQWPSVDASDYDGEGQGYRGADHVSENIESRTEMEKDGPGQRREDGDYLVAGDARYHVLSRHDAIDAISTALKVPRRKAEELLDLGSDGVEAVRPFAGKRGAGKTFRADALQDWAKEYQSRKGRQATDRNKGEARVGRVKTQPHFPAVRQATELDDINSVAAGKMLFGDRAQNRGFRQDARFLSDEFFRHDSFRS